MCGVYGIVSPGGRVAPELDADLKKMGDRLTHRGPDDRREQTWQGRHCRVGLGFTRLAILDLKRGGQPLRCPVDSTVIACNGQVYNYVELRKRVSDEVFYSRGDMEVALHLYRKLGPSFLHELNGMYAGAILDPRRARLLLFRDRFGIKPLYYCRDGDRFLFASEIRPLLAVHRQPARLNRVALPLFFTYRFVPGRQTLFAGIEKLEPATYLDYDLRSQRIRRVRYWEYEPGVQRRRSKHAPYALAPTATGKADEKHFRRDEAELAALFEDSVRIRLRADVEVGSLLSAGIDSSAVCALAADHTPNLRAFNISFAEPEYDEGPAVARLFAAQPERFGSITLHHRRCSKKALERLPALIQALEEPLSLGAVIPTDAVCALAAQHVKVTLSGEGADEIFAGYRKFLLEAAAAEMEAGGMRTDGFEQVLRRCGGTEELKKYLRTRHPDPYVRYIQSEALFGTRNLRRLLGAEHTGPESFKVEPVPAAARPHLRVRQHPLDQLIAIECRTRLPDYVALRLDKLAMRHSLETRTPFLDYRLAQFAGRLPVARKINLARSLTKWICRQTFLKAGWIDSYTAMRPKQPFTIPLAAWLSRPRDLPAVIEPCVRGDMVHRHGVLDPQMTGALFETISRRGVGPDTLVCAADRAFAVLVFTLWYEQFIHATG
jgi:asparagine synthase (glutamine-hydrolysing)